MSETWTPVTADSETWTRATTPGLYVFSPSVFSHAYSGALRVFAIRSADGNREVWDNSAVSSEAWTSA